MTNKLEISSDLLKLKSDWVFKRIFTKEGNEDILIDLLSSILNIEIKKIELQNTELNKESEEQKKSILDVKAVLNDNTICDIEVQLKNEYNMSERNLQHLTKLYSEQLKKGEEYTRTKKVIIINFLDFNYYKRNTYHSRAVFKFEPYDEDTYIKIYDEEEEIYIIEIPKFLKAKNIEESEKTNWLRLMSGDRGMIKMALSEGAEKIKKAYKELEYLSQNKEARAEYDAYEDAQILEQMKIDYAEKRGEKKSKIEIAKKLLQLKVPVETIIESTELTKEEIEKLKI